MDLLNTYLNINGINMNQFHLMSGIPETTVRNINQKPLNKWTIEQIDIIANLVNKSRYDVLDDLEKLLVELSERRENLGIYSLCNRRYIGSKNKILNWLDEIVSKYTEGDVFFDAFAGTGVVSEKMLNNFNEIIINDFLYSNEVIYNAFFSNEKYDEKKLKKLEKEYNNIEKYIDDNYFVENYGNKFFSNRDARLIGEIRERIEVDRHLNKKEKNILLSSLIYSADKIANTVGHYDAYRKNKELEDKFSFNLISPINTNNKKISIYRKDANILAKEICCDVVFIDPPYNSRQYSRFYHLLEELTKWDKPKLEGVAMKPPIENISEFCKKTAPTAFDELITNIKAKYIVVTYNNTYNSKSTSSMNKISHEQIISILRKRGETKTFEKEYPFFNAGKSYLKDHKEYVFLTKVNNYY